MCSGESAAGGGEIGSVGETGGAEMLALYVLASWRNSAGENSRLASACEASAAAHQPRLSYSAASGSGEEISGSLESSWLSENGGESGWRRRNGYRRPGVTRLAAAKSLIKAGGAAMQLGNQPGAEKPAALLRNWLALAETEERK